MPTIDANKKSTGLIDYTGPKGTLNLKGDAIAITGAVAVTGTIATSALATVADPGDGQTITPPANGADFSCTITTGGAETRVLGTPARLGQRAVIVFGTDGGNFTMDNASGWLDGGTADNLATFDDAGDAMIAEAVGTGAVTDWRVTAEKGVAFS